MFFGATEVIVVSRLVTEHFYVVFFVVLAIVLAITSVARADVGEQWVETGGQVLLSGGGSNPVLSTMILFGMMIGYTVYRRRR